jgi:nitroreductase
VILLAYSSAEAYVSRYGEPDKADPHLGSSDAAWTVPYWTGDAAFGVMTALLAAVDAGLGACVLGNFRGEDALARALGIPADWQLFCAVPLGHPDGNDSRSRSLSRERPGPDERIHRGSW